MNTQDPQQQLARRLRALREDRWPGRKVNQSELAQALGVSVPLISSWESQTNPTIPPLSRLETYALVFASRRSFAATPARALSPEDMTAEEQRVMNELKHELLRLRSNAWRAGSSPVKSDHAWPWHFEDGEAVTIVSAQWPPEMLKEMPYTDIDDPDYIELLTYSEIDSLLELHGHLRATNPTTKVNLRVAGKLGSDDLISHLVTLGGIDWNTATTSILKKLKLPVRQVADWDTEGGQYFEVEDGGKDSQFRPVLEKSNDRPKPILREDVALFARATNPYNSKTTATICNGMYNRGTYGAVRALTDAKFSDSNAEYLRSQFGDSDSYCIVTRVPIINGAAVTPD